MNGYFCGNEPGDVVLISDLNKLEAFIHSEVGSFKEQIPGIWAETPVEKRRLFLRNLLLEFHEVFRKMGYYMRPEGLQTLAESRFDDLPLELWNYIRLAFDAKTQEFSCDMIRERFKRMRYPEFFR
ncbi:MAG: hypothetical protein PHQ47_02410 [Candidatus Portnoybacteria bacterium]|nr:hypothetical protein [Candidatus Portnoybacteria bacterium]